MKKQVEFSTLLPEKLVLIFDGSCSFCTWSARLVKSLDRKNRVTIEPFQKPGMAAQWGLTIVECEQMAWSVTPNLYQYGGAAAVNMALAIALKTRFFLWFYALPGIRQVQDAVYRWVVRNRHRLPGVVPYCELFPSECG